MAMRKLLRANEQQSSRSTTTARILFVPLVLLLSSGYLVFYLFFANQKGVSGCFLSVVGSLNNQPATSTSTRRPKLADGCLHVFLDAGANIGIHSRFLFEPHQYPLAVEPHKIFNEAFGEQRDPRDVCAFAFEPNPAHQPRQQALQAAYAKMGWKYFPIHAGVGDVENTTLTFHHNDPLADGSNNVNSEWGFSVVDRYNKGAKSAVEVPIVHLAHWIQREIHGRTIPKTIYGNYNHQPPIPRVVFKMDIEGMEFLVTPSLIFSGIMCQDIDFLFGEFHDAAHIPKRAAINPQTGQGELAAFANWEKARDQYMAMWSAMKAVHPNDCKARYIDMPDKEHYLKDGIPFPTRPP